MHLRRTKTAQNHAQETIGSQSVRSCDCGNHKSNVLQPRNWTSDTSVLLLPSSSGHGHPGCYTVYLEGISSSILPPKLIPSLFTNNPSNTVIQSQIAKNHIMQRKHDKLTKTAFSAQLTQWLPYPHQLPKTSPMSSSESPLLSLAD